jgi:phosphoribosyl 1,2-cyclic phosphodiesterase
MQVSVLASGSKGNSTFVEMDGMRVLIDAGISARRIKKSLDEINVNVADLDGIFLTHEHRDHISGLTTLSKQYHLPIFTRKDTFQSMYCVDTIPAECFNEVGDVMRLGSLVIGAFNISHDAADPVGYTLQGSEGKCTVATDLGFVTSSVQTAIDNSDVLVLEANHDPEILKNGSYPWGLKQRILSNRGHLSNSDAAWALVRMKKNHTRVFLAHLSAENNRPELARDTICDILEKHGDILGLNIDIRLTRQNETVNLWEV